ncbi:MAG TPA: ATP-binding protein [Gemmatimonadaceae bacterium]|nr:ATP-binding protein [Gemmatimonadaceae bacterium]
MAPDAPAPAPADPVAASLRVALELEIPSDVRHIEAVVGLIARHCEQFGFPRKQTALNIPVALTEALSNAILRVNAAGDAPRVQVRADLTDERLVVEIVDEGAGFDLAGCLGDPTQPENLEREEGRGLFLMTSLMDRLERFSSHGNVVRMTLLRHD